MSTFNDAPYSFVNGSNRLLDPVNLSNTPSYDWEASNSNECDAVQVNKNTWYYRLQDISNNQPPSAAPTVPSQATAPTSSSITVYFSSAPVTGSQPLSYAILYGTSTAPTTAFPATRVSPALSLYTATVTGLASGTTYYFKSVATNPYGAKVSAVSAGISTTGGPVPPSAPLKTNLVCPFLIQGPRFGTPSNVAVDYYLNVDAVGAQYQVGGSTATGQQVFAAMYAGTAGAAGDVTNGGAVPVPYAGACTADQVFAWLGGSGPGAGIANYSDTYLQAAQATMGANGRLLMSWGGFFADILGLFGPYQPVGAIGGYPAGSTNPAAADVVRSFLYNYCGITAGNTNPLGWARQNSNNTSSYSTFFSGLILDFENIGLSSPINGYPNVSGLPPANFPASAALDPYVLYPQQLANIVTTYYSVAPTLFLGNAPVSLCIVADVGTTNICAPNTALNTWYAFPTATVPPTAGTYNGAASLALNHPQQMSYFDDVFVQFYNEIPPYYIGGQYFANLLACWGYTALEAQKLGRKTTRINIGLCKGSIIPGGPAPFVAAAQGAPAPYSPNPPPFTYWYPQYCEASPPNNTAVWDNTSPATDPKNLAAAILNANDLLKTATGNSALAPTDWCSGMGFWAGNRATLEAQKVYNASDADSPGAILPALQTYCWSDAMYPSPDPAWIPANIPIQNLLS